MLIVFEGIDGSGKTTLSSLVAEELERRGRSVRHVRDHGQLSSPVADSIRELARDQRHAALSPLAEMLLYAARDAQQLDEAVRPALAEAELVIADRSAYTALVLATWGRGLPDELARPVAEALAGEVTPDLVVLVDAEPHIARARRHVGRLCGPDGQAPSRKRLSGEGLMQRLREGYRALAARQPERWIIVDNSDADLSVTVDGLVAAILALAAGGEVTQARALIVQHRWASESRRVATTPAAARAAFLDWIDRRSLAEPTLAAYFLAGLAGPDYDERRELLARVVPEIVADGLAGLDDTCSWKLRERLLADTPAAVARSLTGVAGSSARAWMLRTQLAAAAPAEVAASLRGLGSPRAWALRQRLAQLQPGAVIASLAGDDSVRAWRWRQGWLATIGGMGALVDAELARAACHSISGLACGRAWEWRTRALAAAPASALASLAGLIHSAAWVWRRHWLERAPRPVLRSLAGLDDARAHELRAQALAFAPEAITSLRGLDSPAAHALRQAAVQRWPLAVARSLTGRLAGTARAQTLLHRVLELHPSHLGLWKHVGATAGAAREATVRSRAC